MSKKIAFFPYSFNPFLRICYTFNMRKSEERVALWSLCCVNTHSKVDSTNQKNKKSVTLWHAKCVADSKKMDWKSEERVHYIFRECQNYLGCAQWVLITILIVQKFGYASKKCRKNFILFLVGSGRYIFGLNIIFRTKICRKCIWNVITVNS